MRGGACACVCVHSVRLIPSCAAPTPPHLQHVDCCGRWQLRRTTDTPARRPSVPTQNYRSAHTGKGGRRARRTGDNGCELGRPRHVFAGRLKNGLGEHKIGGPAEGRTIKRWEDWMLLAGVDEHVGRGRCGGAVREAEMRGARAGGRGARVQLAPVVSGQPLGCRC